VLPTIESSWQKGNVATVPLPTKIRRLTLAGNPPSRLLAQAVHSGRLSSGLRTAPMVVLATWV
jgi:hypothetical protein